MGSQRLPPTVINQWGKVKHDMIPVIKNMKSKPGAPVSEEFKKELVKNVEALFKLFDSGLAAKMKTAATAKSDLDAKKAMQDVVKVSTDYLGKVKTFQQQHGIGAQSVSSAITKALTDIKEAASSSLKAMT